MGDGGLDATYITSIAGAPICIYVCVCVYRGKGGVTRQLTTGQSYATGFTITKNSNM